MYPVMLITYRFVAKLHLFETIKQMWPSNLIQLPSVFLWVVFGRYPCVTCNVGVDDQGVHGHIQTLQTEEALDHILK